MKKTILLALATLWTNVLFAKPAVTIDFVRVTNPLGIVAGTAKGDTTGPVYVTVDNAGLLYTTLADQKGHWAVTFRYFSTTVTADAWQFDNSNSSGTVVREMTNEEIE